MSSTITAANHPCSIPCLDNTPPTITPPPIQRSIRPRNRNSKSSSPAAMRGPPCPHFTACPLAERPISSNLRPMQLGEILDGSFNIYRRHFGLFMRLSLALVWLPTAAGIYMQVRFSNSPFEMLNILEQHTGTSVLFGLLLIIVWTTAGLLLKAGTIRIISDSYLGQEPQLGSALRFGVSKILPLLL